MTALERLDAATEALVFLAAAIATGDEPAIAARATAVLEVGAPTPWVEELLLQSVLMVGYPRALVAAGVWRRVSGQRAPDEGAGGAPADQWAVDGERVCRVIYGENYDRLRQNIRTLHPALDAWMITEGYGRVLSRPGLDLARRELCTVAQLAVLDSPRQLHSHLRGALHAGAAPAVVDALLEAVGAELDPGSVASIARLWEQVRS